MNSAFPDARAVAGPRVRFSRDAATGRRVLECSQWVPAPLDRAFEFFADARNLEAITPAFLRFAILTPLPIEMREGALIDYRLALLGAPLRWRTRIAAWEPPHAFTDVQLAGPYAAWIHRHTFERERDGTRVGDRVEYAVPFAPLSAPVEAWFVRPTLERIFEHRRAAIARLLAASPPVRFSDTAS